MKLEEIIEIVKHDAEYFADPNTCVQAGRAFEANKILNMLYKLEQAQLQQHGVGGPGSDVRSEGEQLGNEGSAKSVRLDECDHNIIESPHGYYCSKCNKLV